jgi:hypothetical protein
VTALLKNTIKIPVGDLTEEGFKLKDEKVFEVTYLQGGKKKTSALFRVVINGIITPEIINVGTVHCKYKRILSKAISWYVHRDLNDHYQTSEHPLTLSKVMEAHSMYAGNIINTLMSISKIDKRDTLSEFNLINI